MKPTRRKDLIIYQKQLITVAMTWIGCFVVFLFAYLLVLAPQNKIKKRVEKELVNSKQEYQFASSATQEETKTLLKKEIDQLQNKVKDFIIDFSDLSNLSFDISRKASEQKITSLSIKNKYSGVSEIPKCQNIGENEIEITFTGSFEQFTSFLSSLERHHPVVFVDEFTLSRTSSDKEGPSLHVNMNVAVFVRKQQ